MRRCSLQTLIARWAKVLVCIVVVQPILTTLHALTVSHSVCADHGELIEGQAGAFREPNAESRAPGVRSGTRGEGAHESHGCVVAAALSPSVVCKGSQRLELGGGFAVTRSTLVPPREAHDSIDLLFMAPKTSPPAFVG